MNQQRPPQTHTSLLATGPTIAAPAADSTTTYVIPLDTLVRNNLLDALRTAADATGKELRCADCTALACRVDEHMPHLDRLRAWHTLVAEIDRLPGIGDDEPMIRFDRDACRAWLEGGAAQVAGIDEGFNSNDLTIAAGLEDLLSALNNEPPHPGWQTVTHLEYVQLWRTADSDGADGGGILTADLSYMGQRVRLASLHQGCDEFTDDPATSGINAAVEALGHVADTLNREYANMRRATSCPPANPQPPEHHEADDNDSYTVIGVWVDDQPIPVGVVAGEHEVSGGDEYEHFPQGVWATTVVANHDLDAERAAIDQMRVENDQMNADLD